MRICLMFSDIRGFTSRSEGDTPEGVINLLNRYFEEMTAAIHGGGGTIDKFMGDSIMALFGVPGSRSDDVARALSCAVEMQVWMCDYGAEQRRKGMLELFMGIGINTGTEADRVDIRRTRQFVDVIDAVAEIDAVSVTARPAGENIVAPASRNNVRK